jgi:CRISPR system Cascade subunit CasE
VFYSVIVLDVGSDPDRPRPGRGLIRNAYRLHQRLCMAFPMASRRTADPDFLDPFVPGDFPAVHTPRQPTAGFLYRVDVQPTASGFRPVILVQSAQLPDWNYAFANAPELLALPCRVRQHEWHLTAGQSYRFRLKANTTTKHAGKRRPVVPDPAQLLAWLSSRAAKLGVTLGPLEPPQTGWTSGYRSRSETESEPMRFFWTQFDGTLTVADPVRLYAALHAGVGPAKAFGFGLLSLAAL